jgi:predicted ferric reductase
MTKQTGHTLLSPATRFALGAMVFVLFLSLLGAEIYVGCHKYNELAKLHGSKAATLITIGKTAGLLAATIVFFQFALTARFKIFDRIFGFDRLIFFHMIMGTTAACIIILHPLLLYGSKVYQLGAFRLELWPQMLGAAALTFLWVIAITSLWRNFLQLKFETWLTIHQLTFITALIVATHSVVLGSDLGPGWPLLLWLAIIAAYITTLIWVKLIKPEMLRKNFFKVKDVTKVSYNTFNLKLVPSSGELFDYLPGQFAFLTLHRKKISPEEHPFTISSSPTMEGFVTFTIKQSGDYTSTIHLTEPDDTATVDAPYGRFSYLRFGPIDRMIMIAGGVGLTPILSCLRHMAATGFDKPVILIWASRTKKNIFFGEELKQIQKTLPDMQIHHVLSDEPDYEGPKGHVTEELLRQLLPPVTVKTQVMLCGPPPMMDKVSASLRNIGFLRKQIHMERFVLAN